MGADILGLLDDDSCIYSSFSSLTDLLVEDATRFFRALNLSLRPRVHWHVCDFRLLS